MTTAIWKGLAAAVVVAATATACGGGDNGSAPATPTSPSNPTTPTNSATITIGSDGRVSPSTVTVVRGGRVTMVNNHSQAHDMWSDPHPEHTQCPELAWGFLSAGQQRASANLNTARTCGFHDHNDPDNAALRGSIVIQ
jgi:plastocyanin